MILQAEPDRADDAWTVLKQHLPDDGDRGPRRRCRPWPALRSARRLCGSTTWPSSRRQHLVRHSARGLHRRGGQGDSTRRSRAQPAPQPADRLPGRGECLPGQSRQRALVDPGGDHHGLYRVWACSMRATSTRSPSSRPCHRRAPARWSPLMIAGQDLGVIGIIGIILLIGIVKKNAIMMIDFALDAERNEGKTPREAIHQAALLRFRPIIMTTLAALFAALPLMLGWGVGSELRHPAGDQHRRRPDRQSGPDPVHHPGDLPALRQPRRPAWARAAQGRVGSEDIGSRARYRAPGRREPLGAVHPSADRDGPADHRSGARGRRGLLPAAGLAAAPG